jgi:hypothetical protein
MLSSLPRVYPLLGLCGGYALLMFFNPIRRALGDGFRCITLKRIWLTFALRIWLFFFSPLYSIRNSADLDLTKSSHCRAGTADHRDMEGDTIAALRSRGIFDNATSTYPLQFWPLS